MTTPAPPPSNELDLLRHALPEALARDDFANLAVLLRYATDGCFAIAVYNSAPAREQVVNALRPLVAPLPVFEWTCSPLDPYPFGYLNRLTDEQKRERAVVFFFGLDKADAAVVKSLDYHRERLAGQPHGLVFWLTPKALGEVARGAPHFWSQRSGVFDFTVAQPDLAQQMRDAAWRTAPDTQAWLIDREEKERELRLYEELLRDYQADPSMPARTLFDLHTRISRLLYYSGRTAESRQHALAALQLSEQLDRPQDRANTLHALGDLGLCEDDLSGARASYEAALALYRAIGDRLGEANALQRLGDLGYNQKRYDDALADYQAAVNLAPQDAWAWNNLGSALASLKRNDDAIAAYSRAIEIEPDTALLYRNRAEVLLDLGRTDEAEADVAQAVRLDPEHPYTRGQQGWLALARGRFAEAVEHFSVAGEADVRWRYGLALAQFARGELDRARATLSAARPDMSADDAANTRLWLERIMRLKPDLAPAAEDMQALLR